MPVDQNENYKPGITILGQHISYPTGKIALYGLISIVGGICLLAFISLYLAKPDNLAVVTNIWSSYNVDTAGNSTQNKNKIIGFWTPSKRTKEAEGVSNWEKILDNESVLLEFENNLSSNDDVNGYRRYEYYGKGRYQPKWGWWWVINVDKDFDMKDLMAIYKHHFNNDKSIYVEVLSSEGVYQ